jgi:hypothetical protein
MLHNLYHETSTKVGAVAGPAAGLFAAATTPGPMQLVIGVLTAVLCAFVSTVATELVKRLARGEPAKQALGESVGPALTEAEQVLIARMRAYGIDAGTVQIRPLSTEPE